MTLFKKAKPIDVMKHFALFLLALIISGVMALSHAPAGATAPSDIGITMVADFKSADSPDRNAVERGNFNIEVLGPDVVTIPENRLNDFSSVGILISVINSYPTPVYLQFDTFIPELVGADGKTIQGEINAPVKAKRSACQLVYQGRNGVLPTSHVLRWKDKTLQLEIFNEDFGLWSFNNLKPGTYQLRFSYSIRSGLVSCYELEQKKPTAVQIAGTDKGVTSFVPLRLVQPVSVDSKTVEVDGIRFEIVMPERVLNIPASHPDFKTPVKLGIRITNNTSTPHRFSRFDTIFPRLLGPDGKALQLNGGRDGTIAPTELDCPLVMPQNSVTFFLDANLFWRSNELAFLDANLFWRSNKLALGGSDKFGGIWYFSPLKPGIYHLGLSYANGGITQSIVCPQARGVRGRLEDFWIGAVNTKFLELSIALQ
jgi:hypothetical protein